MADVEQAGLEVMSGCLFIIFLFVSAIVALLVKLSKPRDADPRGDIPNAWPPPEHDDEV